MMNYLFIMLLGLMMCLISILHSLNVRQLELRDSFDKEVNIRIFLQDEMERRYYVCKDAGIDETICNPKPSPDAIQTNEDDI